ncbi:MAG: hypothetical protein SPL80_07615 [Bacilli bacterium]|nr:hypothetical protein [Bacilli bacterium]
MKRNSTPRYGDAVRGYIRGNFKAYFAIGVAFLFLGLIVAGLALLSLGLAIFAVCFFYLPFLFATSTYIAKIGRQKSMPSNAETLARSLAYFRPPFLGSYRALINLLKSLGVGLLFTMISSAIIAGILGAVDPNFNDGFQGVMSDFVQGDYVSARAILDDTPSLLLLVNLSSYIGIGVGVVFFCFNISNYALNPLIKSRVIAFPSSRISRDYYNRFFHLIWKDYWRTIWCEGYGIALYPFFGYLIGILLGIFFNLPSNAVIAIGIGFVGLILSISLPYYLSLIEEFFRHQRRPILVSQQALMEDLYAQYLSFPGVSQENLDAMKADIEKTKESLQNLDENENVGEEPEDEPTDVE